MEAHSQEMKGRSRLKGVLDVLVQQSKEEREGEVGVAQVVDEDVEEGARDLMELNEDVANLVRKRARFRSPVRRRGRKRLCRDVYYHHTQDSDNSDTEDRHIPHVMTLFDRKVDLARFTLDTPLYVMCREWMWNNPTAHAQNGIHASNGDTGQVNQLVSPTPLQRNPESGKVVRLDIPAVKPRHYEKTKRELERNLESGYGSSNIHDLKMEHLNHWRQVRENWKRSSFLNQERYSKSLQQLRDMFQR